MTHYHSFRSLEPVYANSLVLVDIREAEIPEQSHVEQFLRECIANNDHVTLVSANAGRMHFDQYANENFTLINYPRSFFINYYNYNDPKEPLLPTSNFQYRFACFNNKAKPHRVQLVDHLHQQGEQQHSLITWRSGKQCYTIDQQPAKYFDTTSTIRNDLLDGDEHSMTWKEIVSLPAGYEQCAVDLVTESIYSIYTAPDTVFVTEKSIKPLWHGKLFLTLATPGFHQWLRSQGFLLYDEMFDYGFDTVSNPHLRFRGYWSNVRKLSAMSMSEIEDKYQEVKHKIEHNAYLARTIDSEVPDILVDSTIDRDFIIRFSEEEKSRLAEIPPTYYMPISDK